MDLIKSIKFALLNPIVHLHDSISNSSEFLYKQIKANQMASTTTFNDLPDGLVADILSRLPVKTVLKFMFVRKLWGFLIKSSYFVSLHFSRSLINPPPNHYIFLVHDPSIALFEFGLIPDRPRRSVTDPFPDKFDIQCKDGNDSIGYRIRGACKGLVCLTNYNDVADKCVYLINPFIRKCKTVDSDTCYPHLTGRSNVGISFGYCDNDYKVLRIIQLLDKKRKRTDIGATFVEIYSLKTGKWKIVDFTMKFVLPIFSKAIYAHGCLYWRVDGYLLCFTLKDEVFSKIELPTTYFNLISRRGIRIFNRNDSLVVVLYNELRCSKLKITLLVMEKNFDGRVQWEEFWYDDSKNVLYDSENEDSDYEDEDVLSDHEESDHDEEEILGDSGNEESVHDDEEVLGDSENDESDHDDEDVLGDSENEESDYEDEDEDENECLVCPLGFSADGRLIVEKSWREIYRKERYIVSLHLENSCAGEKLEFCFDPKPHKESGWPADIDKNDGITNVMESLVLFSD